MAASDITAERVRELLDYNPDTGIFTWREARGRVSVGHIAGTQMARYIYMSVDGTQTYAHRLAWLHHYGKQPTDYIDHIDGNGKNNRINNLRDVPQDINMQNIRGPYKTNRTGVKNVILVRYSNQMRYRVKITVDHKTVYCEWFDTLDEATEAAVQARAKFQPYAPTETIK